MRKIILAMAMAMSFASAENAEMCNFFVERGHTNMHRGVDFINYEDYKMAKVYLEIAKTNYITSLADCSEENANKVRGLINKLNGVLQTVNEAIAMEQAR